MANVWYVFQACGFASWLCLLAAIVAIPLTMLACGLALVRSRGAKILTGIAFAASLVPAGVGVLGMVAGRAKVDAVLESGAVDPSFRDRIRDEGYKEADGCVLVGAIAGGFPLVVSLLAVALVLARPPRSGPTA